MLDAILGLFILVVGTVLIASSYIKVHESTQVGFLSNDLLSFFSNTKIRNLNNPYAGIGGELWVQGDITDADNSLLQQIGELYAVNKIDIAERFIQNISKDAVPPQFNYEVWMDGTLIYPQNPPVAHVNSKQNTRLLLVSRKLTFGIINKTTSSIWGPYKAEVFVWEK